MTQNIMYPVVVGAVSTELALPYVAGASTTITVVDATKLPGAPNLVAITSADAAYTVTVQYNEVSGNTLHIEEVVEANTLSALTATYPIGCAAFRPLCKKDIDLIQDNIRDLAASGSEHAARTDNPHSVTKAQIGLGNADNTSDANKPVSTAQAAAIKVVQDDINAHEAKVNNPHSVTKAQVGLGNVDNTADTNKPVSGPQQTALNGKADLIHASRHVGGGADAIPSATTTTNGLMDKADKTKLNTIEEHADVNIIEGIELAGVELAPDADKHVNIPEATPSARGLESAADKTKLNGIAAGAQVNVLEGVQVGGVDLSLSAKKVNITNVPTATKLQTGRYIDGVLFAGDADAYHFGVCTTAAVTAAKTVSVTGFTLATGARVIVKFNNPNRAETPTLNVNSTGAKAIMYRGTAVSPQWLAANTIQEFVYDGTDFEIVGDINTSPDDLEIHGYIVDDDDSNPNTRVTWIRADAGKTTADIQALFESKIRHCVIKAAARKYYVKEDNWDVQEDGVTASGVSDSLALDGNFVVEYPKIWVRATLLGASQKMYEFTWNNPGEGNGWYCPIRFNDELRQFYWMGVTEGVDQTVQIAGSNTVVTRAVYGDLLPSVSQTSETYWQRGFNMGKYEGLADDVNTYHGVGLMTTYGMVVMLDVWRYKTTNFQTNVARGNVDNATKVAVNAGVSLTGGYTQGTPGTSGGTTGCVVGGVANLYGDIWEFKDAAYLYKDFCYNTDAKHHQSVPAVTAANWQTYWNEHHHHTLNLPHARNYVKSMKLSSECPCIVPDTLGGNDAQNYADYHYMNTEDTSLETSVTRCVSAGGYWYSASAAGAFSLSLGIVAGNSGSTIGARLHAFSLT